MSGESILAGAALIVLLPGVLWVVERLLRDPVFAAALVMAVSVYSTLTSGLYPPLSIGGVTILERDILFSLLAGAAVLRLTRRDEFTITDRLVVLLMALVAWSALRGIPVAGPEAALRETRIFLYYFGGLLYFMGLRPTREERVRIARIWIIAATAFAGIVLLRWTALAVGLQSGIFIRSREPGVRVIDAQNTLVIAQAVMLLLPGILRRQASRRQVWIVAAFVPILVGLQHRTIWLVMLVGLTVAGLRHPQLARKYAAGLLAFCLTAVVVLFAVSESTTSPADTVAIQQDPLDEGSILWRVDGWRGLLTADAPKALTVALGAPMGTGYARELATSGVVRDTSPHNFYIQTYLRTGIIGVALLVILLVTLISGLRRRAVDPEELGPREGLFLALIVHAVFLMAWGPDMDQGLVLGLGLSALSQRGAARPLPAVLQSGART